MPRKMQARAGSSRFDFFSRRPRFVSALGTTAIALRHFAAEGHDNMQSFTYHAIEHITPPPVYIRRIVVRRGGEVEDWSTLEQRVRAQCAVHFRHSCAEEVGADAEAEG
jgi:hypothetical protein